MDTIPIYENGKEYPNKIGFYLCHQPQCHGIGCGDLPGIWRLYRIDCDVKKPRRRMNYGPGSPVNAISGPLGIDQAIDALRQAIDEYGLTLNIVPAPNGAWPLNWYADLERIYKPTAPPDPATTCPAPSCPIARDARASQRITIEPPHGGSNVQQTGG